MTGGADLPHVLQAAPYAPAHQAQLEALYTVHDLAALDADPALSARIRAIVTRSDRTLPAALLARLPALELIATFGVGYDGLPLAAAAARGIAVSNTPEVLNTAVAELCVGMLLGLLRQLPAADRFVRAGQWPQGAMALGASLAGKRVGIVGLGRIGKDIARRLAPFEVTLAYHGRHDQQLDYRYEADLVALARASDVLIIAAPGGATTHHLVDAAVLDALGPHGYLVNIARGSLVDEDALVAALRARRLAGAALDVFAQEPHDGARFAGLDNVVLAPHLGSATVETRQAMMALMLENLRRHFAGAALATPVTASVPA